MPKIYISSVSEEGVPNVQYIKEFKAEISTYLFISTNWMQSKNATDKIITTCNLPENTYKVIVVNEESLIDIKTKIETALTDAIFADSEGFIVNCTLGTKIMSIALYDVFHKNQAAKLLYTPIRTNHYRSVLDDSINETFTTKLNLQEYINSYRIDITGKGSILKAADYTVAFKKKFVAGFKQDVIESLRLDNNGVYLNKGVADTTQIAGLNAVLKTLKFTPNTQNQLSAAEVRYLTGGWLEDK
jgi:hypothetical protein